MQREATTANLRRNGHEWAGMEEDVKEFIANCVECQKFANRPDGRNLPTRQIPCRKPFEVLEADTLIVNLEPNEGGFIGIAVILEQITAHVTLEAVKDTTAKETARAILKRYGSFGVPERVAHDGGPEYENNIFSELAKWLQIEDYTTTAHRPQSHGHVERMNSEVLMQIRCLCHHIRNKKDWDMYLPLIEAIVNNIVRKRTGYTANQMLFGMDYAHHRNMLPERELIRRYMKRK